MGQFGCAHYVIPGGVEMTYEEENRIVAKKLVGWLGTNKYLPGVYVIDGREHPYLLGLLSNYGPGWEGISTIKWKVVKIDQLKNVWVSW